MLSNLATFLIVGHLSQSLNRNRKGPYYLCELNVNMFIVHSKHSADWVQLWQLQLSVKP